MTTTQKTKKDIGILISNTLREKGLSYYALEDGSGIQHRLAKRIEKGESRYALDTLIKLCDYLGYEVVLQKKKEK